MRYELMLPHQIKTAIAENWPVVLPLGVLEYHGEHMAVGMDNHKGARANYDDAMSKTSSLVISDLRAEYSSGRDTPEQVTAPLPGPLSPTPRCNSS